MPEDIDEFWEGLRPARSPEEPTSVNTPPDLFNLSSNGLSTTFLTEEYIANTVRAASIEQGISDQAIQAAISGLSGLYHDSSHQRDVDTLAEVPNRLIYDTLVDESMDFIELEQHPVPGQLSTQIYDTSEGVAAALQRVRDRAARAASQPYYSATTPIRAGFLDGIQDAIQPRPLLPPEEHRRVLEERHAASRAGIIPEDHHMGPPLLALLTALRASQLGLIVTNHRVDGGSIVELEVRRLNGVEGTPESISSWVDATGVVHISLAYPARQ